MVILPWSACHLTRLCLKNAPTASQLLQILMCCLSETSKNVILWLGKLTECKIVMYDSLTEWFSYLGTLKTITQKMWVHLIELKSHFSPFVFFFCLFVLVVALLFSITTAECIMQCNIVLKYEWKKELKNRWKQILVFFLFLLDESILLQTV